MAGHVGHDVALAFSSLLPANSPQVDRVRALTHLWVTGRVEMQAPHKERAGAILLRGGDPDKAAKLLDELHGSLSPITSQVLATDGEQLIDREYTFQEKVAGLAAICQYLFGRDLWRGTGVGVEESEWSLCLFLARALPASDRIEETLRGWLETFRQHISTHSTSDTQSNSELPQPPSPVNREFQAIALKLKHPDWSGARIAKAVGVSRTTLYDWPKYRAVAKETAECSSPPRGRIDRGQIEAVSDDEEGDTFSDT